MSKYCHRCGNMMNDGDIFCGNCGTKYVSLNEPVSRSSALPKVDSKRRQTPLFSSIITAVMGSFMIVAIILMIIFSRNPNNPLADDPSFEIERIEEDEGTFYAWLRVTNNGEATIDRVRSNEFNTKFQFLDEEGAVICKGVSGNNQDGSYPIKQGDSFYLVWMLGGARVLGEDNLLTKEKAFSITEAVCDSFSYESGGFSVETSPSKGKVQSRRLNSDNNGLKDASSQYDEFNVLKLDIDWLSEQKDKYGDHYYKFVMTNISTEKTVLLQAVTIAFLDSQGSLLSSINMDGQYLQYDADMSRQRFVPGESGTGQFKMRLLPGYPTEAVTAVLYSYEYIISGFYADDSDTRVIISPVNHTVQYEGDEGLFN